VHRWTSLEMAGGFFQHLPQHSTSLRAAKDPIFYRMYRSIAQERALPSDCLQIQQAALSSKKRTLSSPSFSIPSFDNDHPIDIAVHTLLCFFSLFIIQNIKICHPIITIAAAAPKSKTEK